jgi:hypothetical protein
MANDLRSAYVKEPTEQVQQASQQAKTQTTSFIGEDRTEADQPADKLTFLPFCRRNAPTYPRWKCAICHTVSNL